MLSLKCVLFITFYPSRFRIYEEKDVEGLEEPDVVHGFQEIAFSRQNRTDVFRETQRLTAYTRIAQVHLLSNLLMKEGR